MNTMALNVLKHMRGRQLKNICLRGDFIQYGSRRFLRGRARIEFNALNEMQQKEAQNEHFDEEIDFSRQKDYMKDQLKKLPQFRSNEHEMIDDDEMVDNRMKRSPNLYDRAKQYARFDEGFNTRDQYKDRNQFGKNRGQFYDSRNRNEKYQKQYDHDFDVDERPNRNNRHQFRNDEQDFNRKNNYGYNNNRNAFNQSPNFSRNDFSQNNIYKRYNFSRNNKYNKYNNEEDIDYKNNFNSEDGRPRFSRLREQEHDQQRRELRNMAKDEDLSEENFEVKEIKDNEEDVDDVTKRKRELVPIPFNVTKENRFEIINQMICPLHIKSYDEQLKIKFRKNMGIMQKFGRSLKEIQSPVVRDGKGLPCPLELVKPSPITEKYRNKDEFSIWPGIDGNRKTVGFFVGEPSKHNNVVCVEPDNIILTKDSHKALAKKFENYLREVSPYDICENFSEGGNWRRFHIRSNEAGEHMATAIMHPQQLTEQELNDEMERIRQYFDGDELVTSLFFQASTHTRATNEQAPFRHLAGEKVITEYLSDKKFVISPDSFFQVNRSGAEVLYRATINEINANKKTTVLDICCGTGVLATLIAPSVCRVIGIDSSQSAINDAKRNAALNGINNATFIAGTVEEHLPKLMDDLYSNDIVVVANPTRGGLHSSVISTLREIKHIHKIVYVSCKPEDYAMKNFLHLCIPASRKSPQIGSPFVPINAVPVDMFPHTNHCELIITFERF